jgi:hypothetical protein
LQRAARVGTVGAMPVGHQRRARQLPSIVR